ncbi:MAG: hypothetical protein DIKNOCCD_01185 [bacterium]|nr:hypothetical protein [bacterium]
MTGGNMAHQNAEVLVDFLHDQFGFDYKPFSWTSDELSDSAVQLKIMGHNPENTLALMGVILEDPPLEEHLHSGEPSPSILKLDRDLQALRNQYPSLPLLVLVCPELYRSRIHTWILGEYAAERKLPLWVDLRHLHPARQCDWVRNFTECGLVSHSCVLVIGPGLRREDFPCLRSTGAWLIEEQPPAGWFISQQI